MRTMLFAIALAALSAVTTSPAAAQDRSGEVTTYEFGDDLVTGDVVSPLGERIGTRRLRRFGSLIRARAHFVPELTKSVENL
jgi:hypothetical protein